jgi:hypothetical protein
VSSGRHVANVTSDFIRVKHDMINILKRAIPRSVRASIVGMAQADVDL